MIYGKYMGNIWEIYGKYMGIFHMLIFFGRKGHLKHTPADSTFRSLGAMDLRRVRPHRWMSYNLFRFVNYYQVYLSELSGG